MKLLGVDVSTGLSGAYALAWEHRFHWLMTVMLGVWLVFLAAPLDARIISERERLAREEREMEALRDAVRRLAIRKELVSAGDPFTMERLTRSEFRLVEAPEDPEREGQPGKAASPGKADKAVKPGKPERTEKGRQ